jgi:CRISPR system Cascade subunit CasA
MLETFNLVTEPWIPCVNVRGEMTELSLQAVFEQAHDWRAITDNNPLTVACLHRLLLAIIHHAIDGPKSLREWGILWKNKNFSGTPIQDYLTEKQARFDLFSETAPFYQTPDFEIKKEDNKKKNDEIKKEDNKKKNDFTPSNKLCLELAAGNNKTLFDHNLDVAPIALCPNQAARALITTQMYSLGGGQGPTSNLFGKHPYLGDAPLIGKIVVLLQGDNLFETLLLNLLVYDKETKPMACIGEDLPVWERRNNEAPKKRNPNGYLDYLTWRSRHIRLLPEPYEGKTVVRQIYLAQADSLPTAFSEKERDPMVAYQEKDKKQMPISLRIERAFWRDSASLFAFSQKQDDKDYRPLAFQQAATLMDRKWKILPRKRLNCFIVGLANDDAKLLAWRLEESTILEGMLTNEKLVSTLVAALQWAEKIGNALRDQVTDLARALLSKGRKDAKIKRERVDNLVKTLGTEALFWANLELPFREFLGDLPNRDLNDWQKTVVKIACQAFDNTTENCLGYSARELQARVENDFNPDKIVRDLKKRDAEQHQSEEETPKAETPKKQPQKEAVKVSAKQLPKAEIPERQSQPEAVKVSAKQMPKAETPKKQLQQEAAKVSAKAIPKKPKKQPRKVARGESGGQQSLFS